MARSAALAARAEPMPGDVRLMNVTAVAIAVLAGLLLAGAALLWLARQPLFAIRVITVDGDVGRNSVSTIRANAAPRLAGNFLTLDLVAVRRAFESVPWVRHAVVQKVWPNRLRVRLEEHRPVALWGGGEPGSEKLVNSFGEVFEANVGDVEDETLPTLEGPDGSAARVLAMHDKLEPPVRPDRDAGRCAAAFRPRFVAGDAGHRRRGRDRPRQRRGSGGADRALRLHRAPGDLALPAAARIRRPSPYRRLRGAAERRLDADQRRRQAAEEIRR